MLNVGTKVIIRDDLCINNEIPCGVIDDMVQYRGKICTIASVMTFSNIIHYKGKEFRCYYKINMHNRELCCVWTLPMFSHIQTHGNKVITADKYMEINNGD